MILSVLMLAQAAALPPCDSEAAERGQQQAMNICAQHEFRRADAAMNTAWRKARTHMRAMDDAGGASPAAQPDPRPGYFDTMLEAQRAWLRYRDAHCRSENYAARGGSLEPLLVSKCRTRLTRRRTAQLNELVEGL